jgi:hypothetical protein
VWLAPPLVDATVAMPANTPIPCIVCKAENATELSFSGTVKIAQPGTVEIFNAKTHETMRFSIPADFRGVDSSDGAIKDAPVTRATPGLLARVTYRAAGGHNRATRVLLLTINQCRALIAAERLGKSATECPD